VASRRHRFVQRRKALGFSQERLAHAIGVERSTVVRWESGETEPQLRQRLTLARQLRMPLEELDEILNEVASDRPESNRLNFALNNPAKVDLVAVAYLGEQVQQLNAEYDSASSASLLAAAGQCHGQVSFLRGHAANARIRRELLIAEADSATLMGQLVWDASQRRDQTVSTEYFDQAVNAARQIRDPVLEAHAQLRKGFVALYSEQSPKKGLRLCEEAAIVSDGSSDVLAGLGQLHVGEAYAMLGERKQCEKALSSAEQHFARVDDADEAYDMFSPTQLDRLAGSCYLFLGVHTRAEEILARTARMLYRWKKSRSIVLENLALAYIRQGKLEEACATLHEAIDLIELTRGGGGLNIAFGAGRELSPWRHEPWVQELNDRLFTLIAT
jgi:transcriptional regulator with XRE-family HTH domain